MIEFKPTYLYIKQHSITKKCYFGKTTSEDPVKYMGSGKHWKSHIKKHGKEFVETLWFKLFTDREELIKIATLFSEQQDIVKSDLWLNLIPENGVDGGNAAGLVHSEESKRKMSEGRKRACKDPKVIERMAAAQRGKKATEETKQKMSVIHKKIGISAETVKKMAISNTGKKHSEEWGKNISIAKLSKKLKLSPEHRAKLCKPKAWPKVTCPHCGKTGRNCDMTRCHFDKCKLKK